MTEQFNNLRFERRATYVLPEHRPLYKICQILLILHLASREGKSSLPRLHLFNWALKSKTGHDLLTSSADSKVLSIPAWGFDPILAIGIRFAIAEKLIQEHSAGYKITPNGIGFIQEVIDDGALFTSEKTLMSKIGKRITEKMVDETARGWDTE